MSAWWGSAAAWLRPGDMRVCLLQVIDAAGLVPGDVVLIAIGNVIPADVKILGEQEGDEPIQVSRCLQSGSTSAWACIREPATWPLKAASDVLITG